jgi:hypothetical protein
MFKALVRICIFESIFKSSRSKKYPKSLFKFILVWLQFKFGLNVFWIFDFWIQKPCLNSKNCFCRPSYLVLHFSHNLWKACFAFSFIPTDAGPVFWPMPAKPTHLGAFSFLGSPKLCRHTTGRAAAPYVAIARPLAPGWSWSEAPSCGLHFPPPSRRRPTSSSPFKHWNRGIKTSPR